MNQTPGYEAITEMYGLNLLKVGDREVEFDDQLFLQRNNVMIPLGTLRELRGFKPLVPVDGGGGGEERINFGDNRIINNLFVSNAPKDNTPKHVKLGVEVPIGLPERGDFSFIVRDEILRNALTEAYSIISNIRGGWERTDTSVVINAISSINMGRDFPDQRRMMFEMSISKLAQDGWGPFVYAWLESSRQDQPVETEAKFANAVLATPIANAHPFVHAATNPIVWATLITNNGPPPPNNGPPPPNNGPPPPGGKYRRRRTNKRGKKSGRKSRNQKRRRSRNRKYKR